MTGSPTCHYVTLPTGGQLHYRRLGAGPPLILLHPSPQDSQAVIPAMQAFADICSCIALDTPGYGLSDDGVSTTPTLDDYADAVIAAADALGIGRFALYGAATGAQIAIALGKRHPDRAAFVMLDSNGHLDRAEQAAMMDGYFPDVAPKRDGSHLMTWWDMCSSVFAAFPWHSDRAADHLPLPRMPAETVHELLRRYLDAGTGYAKAYRLALEAEHIDHLRDLTVPATMMRWEGSIVLNLADAMIAQGLPQNIRVLRAGAPLAERYGVQAEALRAAMTSGALPEWTGPSQQTAKIGRGYRAGLHGYASLDGNRAPIAFLHGAGQSHRRWSDERGSIERPFIALDLPGHGHSPDDAAATLESMADAVADALDDAGIHEVELVGEGLGAAIAVALAQRGGGRRAVVLDPLLLPTESRHRWISALPDLTPRDSGAHLIEAWHFVRQTALRHPWFDGSLASRRSVDLPSPAETHERVADLVRCTDPGEMQRREIALDWLTQLEKTGDRASVQITLDNPAADAITRMLRGSGIRYSVGPLAAAFG